MKRRLLALLPVFLLGGCVAVWGQSYDIDSASADSITIKYDVHFTTPEKIKAIAEKHCAEYGKKAVLQQHDRNIVYIDTATYDCK